MIKQEILENGLVKTYSDSGFYIIQNETGNKYAEAIDVSNDFTYTESNEKIKTIKSFKNKETING